MEALEEVCACARCVGEVGYHGALLLAAAAAEGAVAAAVLCAPRVLGDGFGSVAEFAGAFEEPF